MNADYTEDTLVDQEEIKHLLEDLKYDEHLNCFDEKFPETLGRETTSEVVLKDKLIKAIKKLNSNLPEEAITIKVGAKTTKAKYYTDSVESVRSLLKELPNLTKTDERL